MLDRTPSRELREDLWVFPMDYPIKLIGNAGAELRIAVVEILIKHFPEFDEATLAVQPSRTGKYHSITAQLRFENLSKFTHCMQTWQLALISELRFNPEPDA
jgi:putative lipoic acid-binding regulatory protein